jgi:hypothetical protein
MNTLGLRQHPSITTSLPNFQWSISLIYEYVEDFEGTSINACFIPEVYMLCHRFTLYFLMAMILLMKPIHYVLFHGHDLSFHIMDL